jgi:DNA repair exonuclease SbcCD nuclease subunit
VLAGHVHRHQLLRRDLGGRALPTPVLYAGSTERTSFAERDEDKGSLILELAADGTGAGRLASLRFRPTPSRPMVQLDLPADRVVAAGPLPALSAVIRRQHPEAIVRLKLHGPVPGGRLPELRTAALRASTPPTMNVSVRWTEDPTWRVDA